MVVRNMLQLTRDMQIKAAKAMNEVQTKVLLRMFSETQLFYNKVKLISYKRTGALKYSPRVSDLTSKNGSIGFNAYLDLTHKYKRGNYTTPLIMDYAEGPNRGKSRIQGRPGFWRRSLDGMFKDLEKSIKRYFTIKRR